MYGHIVDREWVRILNESDLDGNQLEPRYARNVRTANGMIIGRVVRGASDFAGERFKGGAFVGVGSFHNIEDAAQAIARERP